jgi:hypothetical protein
MKIFVMAVLLTGVSFAQTTPKHPAIIEMKDSQSKLANPSTPGAFGFEAGMRKEDLIAKLGQSSVKRVDGDTVIFTSAPRPHPAFKDYLALFSPDQGLVKVMALSGPIATNQSGDQLRERFDDIAGSLRNKYGSYSSDVDFVKEGSMWTKPQYWMMSLLKKDRQVFSVWPSYEAKERKISGHLVSVMLEAEALSLDSGVIQLTYEFDGFNKYAEASSKKRDSVF